MAFISGRAYAAGTPIPIAAHQGVAMFERERVRRPQVAASPGGRGLTPALDSARPDTATAPPAATGFAIGNIAILPPAPRVGPEGGALAPDLAGRIRARQGAGSPLQPTVQREMEAGFGQ